jgi:hypothetical protein
MHGQQIDVPNDNVFPRRKDWKHTHLTQAVIPIPVDLAMLEDLFMGAPRETGGDQAEDGETCEWLGSHGDSGSLSVVEEVLPPDCAVSRQNSEFGAVLILKWRGRA